MRRKQDLEVSEGLLIVDWWIGSSEVKFHLTVCWHVILFGLFRLKRGFDDYIENLYSFL